MCIRDRLQAVLKEKGSTRVIVFARTKNRTEDCAEMLCDAGFSAESIHSDKSQGQRRRALENFRRGRTDILVATDVLARGIDVTGVDHVINYDLPDMPEDYVHRIGRTGLSLIHILIEQNTMRVDGRVRVTSFGAEETLTADLVPLDVNAVLFWHV